MKFMERARAAVQAFISTPPPATDKTAATQVAWNLMFTTGLDRMPSASLTMPFAQHPTVHAAVDTIASSISGLPIEMFLDSDTEREEPIDDSIVGELLANPGPDMDGPQFLEASIQFMKLEGEAFWFMDGFARRTGGGPKFPTRLTLWEPHNVRAIVSDSGFVTGWEYQHAQEVFRTAAENVIQFKHSNPYDPIRGLSPLLAAQIAAEGGYKALQYQDTFLNNSAIPTGLLMPQPGSIVQPEAMARLRNEIEGRHMGPTKQGRLGAIAAPVDFKQFGTTQKDMEFQQWLDTSSEFILMVFRVPPAVAGLQKDANYSAAMQQAKQFWFNHLPLAHYFERRIKLRLCKQFGIAETPYFKTETIKALTEDQESLSNQARNYWNMGVPFKDINERLELGFPAEGPAAETGFIPFSLVNADEQALAPASDATGGPNRSPRPNEDQNQLGDNTQVDAGKSKQLHMTEESRLLFRAMNWRTVISRIRDEEMAYVSRLRGHFYQLKLEVLQKLHEPGKSVRRAVDIRTVMFDEDRAADDLEKKVEPLYKSAVKKGAESIVAELNLTGSFDFLSPQVAKFLHEKMFEIADLVDGPLANKLRASLEEGVAKGEAIPKLADRIEEVFSVERSRAYRIARTEVAEAFNGGRFATMQEAGVTEIEWLTARDSRVRESHADIDGEKIVLGDKFSNGLLYPLDPSGPPEEIVNCRCIALPVA